MMNQVDVKYGGREYRFRTNESGFGLFVGDSENKQISHDNGFDSWKRITRAIRAYLVNNCSDGFGSRLPHAHYISVPGSTWKP